MAEIIDGKLVSQSIREQIKLEVENLKAQHSIIPGLAVILVGENPASCVYVRNKHKACIDAGINSYEINLPDSTTEDELLAKIDELNNNPEVDGILVQLPLPKHINEDEVIKRISPDKDVDGFHPYNVGRMTSGLPTFLPCTPHGIMKLLEFYNVDNCGKNCVVIGRSNIVGKPISLLLLAENGTVTVCHSKTQNLKEITSKADILVVAIGRANFVSADMVKEGAVVLDVGINRGEDGKLYGDVDFENVSQIASKITPVPGGVGPMTITMLLKNTVDSAKKRVK